MKAIQYFVGVLLFFLFQAHSYAFPATENLQCVMQPSIMIVPMGSDSLTLQCPAGTVMVNRGQFINKPANVLFFHDKPGICKVVDLRDEVIATFNAVYVCRADGSSEIILEPPVHYNIPQCSAWAPNCSQTLVTRGLQIIDSLDVDGKLCLCPIFVRP